MPTLAVERDVLFDHIGRVYSDEEFDELCFEFGVELDDITSERDEATKSATVKVTKAELESLSNAVVYKIDVPANRYDLLCVEGLSRALRVFQGEMTSPTYTLEASNGSAILNKSTNEPWNHQQMTVVQTNTSTIRPFIVCAILRNVSFTPQRYKSFLDLQDQLHRNLCRNRTLVAIGTHDLDSVQGPFTYDARSPQSIRFVPLTHDSVEENITTSTSSSVMDAASLLQLYATNPSYKHLKPYVPIIADSPLYPVVLDANGVVMSLPPIINGSHSKITLNTKNVFIECTATDLTKANIVLDTMVCMFSEYTEPHPFVIEPVQVTYILQDEIDPNTASTITQQYTTPTLLMRKEKASVAFINSLIGIDISPQQMVTLCERLQLGPAQLLWEQEEEEKDDGGNTTAILEVTVPPTRSDILHAVDIAEDIGIAYGYNNIVKRTPATCTVGREQPLNQLGDLLREEIARAGYTEVLTHGLCSLNDNFVALRRPITLDAVHLSNPANVEYQVVRTTLLPGLLKTLQHNKSASFTKGFKIFEISDVVVRDTTETVCDTIIGAKNTRRICAVYAGPTSGFEIIHGLVDRIMTLCEVCPEADYCKNSSREEEEKYRVVKEGWFYTICSLDECSTSATTSQVTKGVIGTYFPGRSAAVLLTNPKCGTRVSIGSFGVLHPDVLNEFDILYPASCVEMDLEPLL